MDPAIILIVALAIIGPAIIFILKAVIICLGATIVASAISPTIVVKKDNDNGNS